MPLFQLVGEELSVVQEASLELESQLEDWLENSPWAIAQEPLLWIGRQPSASDGGETIFPDLLGVDSEGNLIVVELKKEQAPRDVVAQLLEYAAWASNQSEEQIFNIAEEYFAKKEAFREMSFSDAYREAFEMSHAETIPPLNRSLRLFIMAKEMPARIQRVCRFLRVSYGMDVSCIEFSVLKNKSSDEVLISMDQLVGGEDVIPSNTNKKFGNTYSRWSSDITVRQVVRNAVQELTSGDKGKEFAPKDLKPIIRAKHPDFKMSNISPEIHASCVNSPSRKYYRSTKEYYWQIEKGKYRLFNAATDK